MYICDFGSERERVKDHTVQELTGEYDRLRLVITQLDYVLLDPADLFDGKDGTELASRDKNRIGSVKDTIDVLDGLLCL